MKIPQPIKEIIAKNTRIANFLKSRYDAFLDFSSKKNLPNVISRKRVLQVMDLAAITKGTELERLEFFEGNAAASFRDGTKFFIRPGRSITSILLYDGDYEKSETDIAKESIKEGWVVFDVGANFGWYSAHFSKYVGKTGRVFSFEPIPSTYTELKENIALNECENIVPIHSALGDRACQVKFFVPETFRGSGIASEHNYYGGKVSVDMTTLDAFVASRNIERVDFIKADIEGGELNLLRGGIKTIERFRPRIILELGEWQTSRFGYHPKEALAFLGKLGYHIFAILEDGMLAPVNNINALPPSVTDTFYFK